MAADATKETEFEIGHVLFIDIVGYSKLLIEEQKERLVDLTKIVLGTAPVRDSTDEQANVIIVKRNYGAVASALPKNLSRKKSTVRHPSRAISIIRSGRFSPLP